MKTISLNQWWNKFSPEERCNFTGIIKYNNGSCQEYIFEGKVHRLDGPAYINGHNEHWFYRGKEIFVKSQEEFESWLIVRAFE